MTLQRLALFDLDHTLIPFDSDYSWGEFTVKLGWNDAVEFKRRNEAFLPTTKPARWTFMPIAGLPRRRCAARGRKRRGPPMPSTCKR